MIACEDTRHTGQLIKILEERYAKILDILPNAGRRYVSVRDWNEAQMVDKVIMELTQNDVALVSDAGTPLLSDPGFKVVRAVRAAGGTVTPVPGVFAGAVAASVAGLPTNKIMFLGFLPKKWVLLPATTTIIYESPVRLEKTVQELKTKYPTAQIVIASELTKIHEYVGEEIHNKGEAVILAYLAE